MAQNTGTERRSETTTPSVMPPQQLMIADLCICRTCSARYQHLSFAYPQSYLSSSHEVTFHSLRYQRYQRHCVAGVFLTFSESRSASPCSPASNRSTELA